MVLSEEKLDELLPRNKHTFQSSVNLLYDLLKRIEPKEGHFLFIDIIGRIVWNAIAVSNSMNTLIKKNDSYGVGSLSRKLFECHLLLEYLFSTENKNKAIALIMAYHAYEFKNKSNDFDTDQAIEKAEIIINRFGEDPKILEYLRSFLDPNRKQKNWHWSEMSFKKIIKKYFGNRGNEELNSMIIQLKLKLLNNFNNSAHVDLDLSNDYLKKAANGDLEYVSPFKSSKKELLGLIGLARQTIKDIIEIVESNLELKVQD